MTRASTKQSYTDTTACFLLRSRISKQEPATYINYFLAENGARFCRDLAERFERDDAGAASPDL